MINEDNLGWILTADGLVLFRIEVQPVKKDMPVSRARSVK